MKRTYMTLAVTLSLGAAVMVLFPYRAVTPGTLSEGHRTQKDDCFSCHTLLAGAPGAKCQVCHKAGDIGLRSVKGSPLPRANPRTALVHKAIGGECARCHAEHGGRSGSARRFSHEMLPAEFAAGCTACHSGQRPKDAIHSAVSAECSSCHGTKAWKPATYDHDRSFRFDSKHPARCADCHPPGLSLKEYTCTGCHEHSLDRLERKHREEGITNLEKCRKCHPSGNEDDTIKEGGGREKREGGHDED